MSGSDTEKPAVYSKKLGRTVTVRSCECSAATRHTVLGPKTLECDHCGRIKLGVSGRYVDTGTDEGATE